MRGTIERWQTFCPPTVFQTACIGTDSLGRAQFSWNEFCPGLNGGNGGWMRTWPSILMSTIGRVDENLRRQSGTWLPSCRVLLCFARRKVKTVVFGRRQEDAMGTATMDTKKPKRRDHHHDDDAVAASAEEGKNQRARAALCMALLTLQYGVQPLISKRFTG